METSSGGPFSCLKCQKFNFSTNIQVVKNITYMMTFSRHSRFRACHAQDSRQLLVHRGSSCSPEHRGHLVCSSLRWRSRCWWGGSSGSLGPDLLCQWSAGPTWAVGPASLEGTERDEKKGKINLRRRHNGLFLGGMVCGQL